MILSSSKIPAKFIELLDENHASACTQLQTGAKGDKHPKHTAKTMLESLKVLEWT